MEPGYKVCAVIKMQIMNFFFHFTSTQRMTSFWNFAPASFVTEGLKNLKK